MRKRRSLISRPPQSASFVEKTQTGGGGQCCYICFLDVLLLPDEANSLRQKSGHRVAIAITTDGNSRFITKMEIINVNQ